MEGKVKNLFMAVVCMMCFLSGSLAQAEANPDRIQFIIMADEDSPSQGNRIKVKGLNSGEVFNYSEENKDRLKKIISVEVIIRKGDAESVVSLPYIELNNLAAFLRDEGTMNCASFVSKIKEDFRADFNLFEDEWPLIENQPLYPGDVVALGEDGNCTKAIHYAIYLGEDLYLSRYNMTGILVVSSLKKMEDAFQSGCAKVFKKF